MEYNCQLFLNRYLNKRVNYKYNEKSNNTMLLFDTRLSLNLISVIKNAIDKLPNFNLMIASTKDNLKRIENILGINFIKLEVNKSKISTEEFSSIFLDHKFWEKIPGENILFFQSDSIFLRPITDEEINEKYSKFAMIGPVSVNFEDKDKFIINGGFSLRNKNKMIELSKNKMITSRIEDWFFTEQIRYNYPNLMPSIDDCHDFAIESFGNMSTAKGLHGSDKFYRSFDFYKELFDTLEISV